MILNVPTAEELSQAALRLHFSAWTMLGNVLTDFDRLCTSVLGDDLAEDDADLLNLRAQYKVSSQADLETICTLLQQANEIGLKGEICKVSPYLLLLNSEHKFRGKKQDIQFHDLRTIDAVDLPAAVNAIADKQLSEQFIQQYNQLRSIRNGIIHLGRATQPIDAKMLIKIVVTQFEQLWSDRSWIAEKFRATESSRNAIFADYKYFSPATAAMEEWIFTFGLLPRDQFKQLTGKDKRVKRYLCLDCVDNASTRYSDFDFADAGTAYLSTDQSRVSCLMCEKDHLVRKGKCKHPGCRGNWISSEGYYEGLCHTCGEHASGKDVGLRLGRR